MPWLVPFSSTGWAKSATEVLNSSAAGSAPSIWTGGHRVVEHGHLERAAHALRGNGHAVDNAPL